MSGSTFNFGSIQQTASGAGSVNQIGENTATTHNGNSVQVPTLAELFSAIAKAIPGDEGCDVNESIITPIQKLAELPPIEQVAVDTQEQAQSFYSRLKPYAPALFKGVAVFSEAALTSLASSNPIVAGLLAVIKEVNKQS